MINYIVATYFGTRRNEIVQSCLNKDPFFLLKKQLLSFNQFTTDRIHKATFIVNLSDNVDIDSKALNVFDEYVSMIKKTSIMFEMIFNDDNKHISYGAWNFGLTRGINDDKTEYFFLMEDDYVFCSNEFYEPYIKKSINDDAAFVCQLWQPATKKTNIGKTINGRVGITNGLLKKNAVHKIHEKYGYCLRLDVTPEYQSMIMSNNVDKMNKKYLLSSIAQQNFVRPYEEESFIITDLGPSHKQLFLNSKGIREYGGNIKNTIEPIHQYDNITKESFK